MRRRTVALFLVFLLVFSGTVSLAEEAGTEELNETVSDFEEGPAEEKETDGIEEPPATELWEEETDPSEILDEQKDCQEVSSEVPETASEEEVEGEEERTRTEETEKDQTEEETENETDEKKEEDGDPTADVETAADWEATLPNDLSGVWGEDIVKIAQSQIGYTESTRNYVLAADTLTEADPDSENGVSESDGSKRKGYTRYGAWYGSPYDDWCAMFASFCLYYAGVPTSVMPEDSGTVSWIQSLKNYGIYVDKGSGYQPVSGDLIFFSMSDQNYQAVDHVGIVESTVAVCDEEGQRAVTGIYTIEGNSGNAVRENYYDVSDIRILGYGVLPGQSGVDEETPVEWEACLPELTGDTAKDLVSVARSQIGYTESGRNFVFSSDWGKDGYTRYGAWYGNPYGDWDAMFVGFCMHYAKGGLEVPDAATASDLLEVIKEASLYETAEDYIPTEGDLVFFGSENGDADSVAILEYADSEICDNGEDKITLTVIQGDCCGTVCELTFSAENERVLGYGSLTGLVWDGYFDIDHPERGGIMIAQIDGNTGGTVTAEIPAGAFDTMVTLKAKASVYPSAEADENVLKSVLSYTGMIGEVDILGLYFLELYFIDGDGERAEPAETVSFALDTSKAPVDLNIGEKDSDAVEEIVLSVNEGTGTTEFLENVIVMNEDGQMTGSGFEAKAFSFIVWLLQELK